MRVRPFWRSTAPEVVLRSSACSVDSCYRDARIAAGLGAGWSEVELRG